MHKKVPSTRPQGECSKINQITNSIYKFPQAAIKYRHMVGSQDLNANKNTQQSKYNQNVNELRKASSAVIEPNYKKLKDPEQP